jgi:inositol-phosphate phosphatase/L-galactose 1-phosphate phosphatase/histidinol-phosphatase
VTSQTCPAEFIALAQRLADAAGAAIRPHFRTPFPVETKPDRSPVTVADRASEKAMRDLIEVQVPDHGIIGEEYGKVREDAEYRWILDPIDGTKSFATGLPIFGTLIALVHGDRPILGIIDQPILGERWLGAVGRQTTLSQRRPRPALVEANTRPCPELGLASLFATTFDRFSADETKRFQALVGRVRINRMAGDCYAYAMLASGYADLVVDAVMQPYDFAALAPVIEGAGGIVTDWEGNALPMDRPSRVLAAGDRRVHQAAREILTG